MKKYNFKNIKSYLQGKIRYRLFYSKFACLIPKHIREQITYRINSMDLECYEQGQCKLCHCETTALQMANKACDKPCYPEMQTKQNWGYLKLGSAMVSEGNWWSLDEARLKFIKL